MYLSIGFLCHSSNPKWLIRKDMGQLHYPRTLTNMALSTGSEPAIVGSGVSCMQMMKGMSTRQAVGTWIYLSIWFLHHRSNLKRLMRKNMNKFTQGHTGMVPSAGSEAATVGSGLPYMQTMKGMSIYMTSCRYPEYTFLLVFFLLGMFYKYQPRSDNITYVLL